MPPLTLATASPAAGEHPNTNPTAHNPQVLFAPIKVAQYLNKLNKKAEATRLAQRNALECKNYDRSAQLEQHTLAVLREAEELPLDADPLDTVHKAKERELIQ